MSNFLNTGNPSSGTAAEQARQLLKKMTIEEKLGQLVQAEWNEIVESDIAELLPGSLFAGGGSSPSVNTPEAWLKKYNHLQGLAMNTRLKIPMLFGIDAVHGNNNVYGSTFFPHNIGMGAARDPALVEKSARITAIEVTAIGFHWNFSPCLAVALDERWGRTYESYGEDPGLVSQLGLAAVRGYQGTSLKDKNTLLATLKHYVADGGTDCGVNDGNSIMDETALRNIHLFPYIEAIKNGAASIMPSFSSWNGEKMHGHRYLVTDLLKGELGFEGLVVSDWNAHIYLPGSESDKVRDVFNAGVDMFMSPDTFRGTLSQLKKLYKEQAISIKRINEAVLKILTAKYALGLFDNPFKDSSDLKKIGCAEHRAVAREAVKKSLVLLKNDNHVLPLNNTQKILVTGSKADDLGSQCGGLTVEWQGATGAITVGTTILEAIQKRGKNVIYDPAAADLKNADVVVIVIGETPYAEGKGDSMDLTLSGGDRERLTAGDKAVLTSVKKAGIPYVVILLSGRPVIATEEIKNSDAFIAAWLPGSEGDGVADVLFGDYGPTGKLPCTWPEKMEQIPVNYTDDDYDRKKYLFPYGYGLTY